MEVYFLITHDFEKPCTLFMEIQAKQTRKDWDWGWLQDFSLCLIHCSLLASGKFLFGMRRFDDIQMLEMICRSLPITDLSWCISCQSFLYSNNWIIFVWQFSAVFFYWNNSVHHSSFHSFGRNILIISLVLWHYMHKYKTSLTVPIVCLIDL